MLANKYTKAALSYTIGLLLIVFSVYLIYQQEKYNSLIERINFNEVLISSIIVIFIFLFTGLQVSFLAKKQFNTALKTEDLVLLPIMMHLWSYLIPFRGGLIFSSIFLNQKYKLKLSQGFSIGFYSFFISIILSGLYGVFFSLQSNSVALLTFSILFIVGPVIGFILNFFFKKINIHNKPLKKLKTLIEEIFDNLAILFNQRKINIVVLSLIIGSTLIFILWFYHGAKALGIDISFSQIIIVALITRLSIIVRVIPGNAGIQEFFTGGALVLAGGSLSDGIAISLFTRFVALTFAIIVGILGMISNKKHINFQKLKKQILFIK